jgi:hypothetical protein
MLTSRSNVHGRDAFLPIFSRFHDKMSRTRAPKNLEVVDR